MPDRSHMKIEIFTLGRLAIRVDGREVPNFSAQPVRTALLVYLAVAGEAPRDLVMALLWPESDAPRARHALRQTLYELKRTLGEEWLEIHGELLRVGESVFVDAVRFRGAMENASYEEALDIYGGSFLHGWHLKPSLEFQHWVDSQREQLSTLFREACREHATACLSFGDQAGAVGTARKWAVREPLDTEAQHLLMTLLLEGGDPHQALLLYRRYEARLRNEELEPLPETVRLLERIQLAARGASTGSRTGLRKSPHHGTAIGETEPRVAVLPFEHIGDDKDRHFTEGFTDELISHLARIPEIAVIARTSAMQYGSASVPPGRIGEELGVEHLVRGTVRWDRSGNRRRARIRTALIRAVDAVELWAETYEAEVDGGFEVQREVAERVAAELGVKIAGPTSLPGHPLGRKDLQAYELYLKGFQYANHRNRKSLSEAVRLFQEALGLHPTFARAYAGLALVYAMMPGFVGFQPREWYLKARSAAERALALDPDLAEAYNAMATCDLLLDWDLAAAEGHLTRALDLAPSYAEAWVRLGYVLCTVGQFDAAREAADRGLALDPLSVATNFDVGFQFWQLRDRERAIRQFRRVQELDPGFDPAHFFIGGDHLLRGEVRSAQREWSRIEHQGPLWQRVVERIHQPEAALDALGRLLELAPGPTHFYMAAVTSALLGGTDQALCWLEGHYRNVRGEAGRLETGGPSLTHIVQDPFFDGLRSDERFTALLRGMGLEEAPVVPAPRGGQGPSDGSLMTADS
jgi:DNA-binding SARP family transcriptional activator/lipoprotein NlpI